MPTFEKEFVERYNTLGDFGREDGCNRLYKYARQPATTITAETDTNEEAQKQIKSQLPEGYEILSRKILSNADPQTLSVAGESTEAIEEFLKSFLPEGSIVVEKRVLHTTQPQTFTVSALDEQKAIWLANGRLKQEVGKQFNIARLVDASATAVRVIQPPRKGFLGIGSKAGKFDVELNPVNVFDIVHRKPKAVISARINKYDLYFAVRSPEDEAAMHSSGSVHDPMLVWQR
ncbi:MAG: hypothetical protein HYZ26_12140 [Chloroflexi bacterium]|nr:hypothetical protein [Chloroflexota bacterium]